jgi:hypothetical protein
MRCSGCDAELGPVAEDEQFDDHYCIGCRAAIQRIEDEIPMPPETIEDHGDEDDRDQT